MTATRHSSTAAISASSAILRRQARAIRILSCLQAGPVFNARELADRLSVSRRTVYRDLKLIREAGVNILFDDEHCGYRVSASYPHDVAPPHLTSDDLTMLLLSAQFSPLQAMPQFRLASRESMSRLLGCYGRDLRWPIARLMNCCEIEFPAPRLSEKQETDLMTVCEAIRRRRVLDVLVVTNEFSKSGKLAPYRVKLNASRWSLVAKWSHSEDVQCLDMDHFMQIKLADQAYLLPRGFNADLRRAYAANVEPGKHRTAS